MTKELAAAISAAIFRAVAVVLGGVALCASILWAVGFALVALYSALVPSLGPASAAIATSGAALAVPMAATLAIVAVARASLAQPTLRPRPPAEGSEPTVDGMVARAAAWITENPTTASLGALSLGVALGASPDLRRSFLNGVDAAFDQSRPRLH